MKIHKLIRTNQNNVHDKCQTTNLNTTVLRRSWRAPVLLPLRRCRRPLCSPRPRVVCGVREGVLWMTIASSHRRLGGGVAKGAPELFLDFLNYL
jgi:hypothetical protein